MVVAAFYGVNVPRIMQATAMLPDEMRTSEHAPAQRAPWPDTATHTARTRGARGSGQRDTGTKQVKPGLPACSGGPWLDHAFLGTIQWLTDLLNVKRTWARAEE